MLFITSFVGSLVGFSICYYLMSNKAKHLPHPIRMRMCMGNSMALSFLFAMFVETVTGNKWVSVLVSLMAVSLTLYFSIEPGHSLEMIEALLWVIMGVAMGVMLMGMVSVGAIWILQLGTIAIEVFLWFIVKGKFG